MNGALETRKFLLLFKGNSKILLRADTSIISFPYKKLQINKLNKEKIRLRFPMYDVFIHALIFNIIRD